MMFGYGMESYLAEAVPPILLKKFYAPSRVYLKHYKSADRLERITITEQTLRAVADCIRQ
jgi:hypothetical protein